MNSNQVKYFFDLTKTHNFTQTAHNFYTSQSNISKNIKKLEREVGTKLFKREYHKVNLTTEGKFFDQRMQTIENIYKDTIYSIQARNKLDKNKIHLECTSLPFELEFLPLALRIAKNQYHLSLEINTFVPGKVKNFANFFKDTKTDILLFQNDYFANQSNIGFKQLFQRGFSAVVPKNNHLAKKEALSLEDLTNAHIFLWVTDSFSPIFENFRFKLKKKLINSDLHQSNDIYTILSEVRASNTIGIMPSILYDPRNTDLRYIPLQTNIKIPYGINYQKNNVKQKQINEASLVIQKAITITLDKWNLK